MDKQCPECESPMITAKCGCGWLDREALRRTGATADTKPRPVVKNSLDRLVSERKRDPKMVQFMEKLKSASPEQRADMRKRMLSKLGGSVIGRA